MTGSPQVEVAALTALKVRQRLELPYHVFKFDLLRLRQVAGNLGGLGGNRSQDGLLLFQERKRLREPFFFLHRCLIITVDLYLRRCQVEHLLLVLVQQWSIYAL